jgi:hypothetical protein
MQHNQNLVTQFVYYGSELVCVNEATKWNVSCLNDWQNDYEIIPTIAPKTEILFLKSTDRKLRKIF